MIAGKAKTSDMKSKFDFEDVHTPICTTCRGRAWPIICSRAGKVHCMAPNCSNKQPEVYMPSCFQCGAMSFDGQWRGTNQCALGKGFMCRRCCIAAHLPLARC